MGRRYFGTDGIRGEVGTPPMTVDFALRLASAAARVLAPRGGTVLIGKDTRVSGYMFESALEAGFVAAGVDVLLTGPLPTPAIAHLTKKLGADYIGLTDLPLFKQWIDMGILASYKPASFDAIPADLKDADGRWYYVVRPITSIAINTENVKEGEEPKSWTDLFDPKWKGKIGMQDPLQGGGVSAADLALLTRQLATLVRAVSQVRSITGRRQLRWIAWGTALGVGPFACGYALPYALGVEPSDAAEDFVEEAGFGRHQERGARKAERGNKAADGRTA